MNKILISIFVFIVCCQVSKAQNEKAISLPTEIADSTVHSFSVSNDGEIIAVAIDSMDYHKLFLYITGRYGELILYENVKPKSITDNKKYYIGNPTFNSDNKTVFFDANFNTNTENTDIYYITLKNSKWSEPIKLKTVINTSLPEYCPAITADMKTMYFIRKDADVKNQNSYCGKIYKSQKLENGQWSKASPLPYPINSSCEYSPFMYADNKILLFASKRNNSESFNIYYSQQITENIWSIPEIIDSLSGVNNFLLQALEKNNLYYLEKKDRKNVKLGSYNISKDNITTNHQIIKGRIIDAETNNGLQAKINVSDINTGETLFRINCNQNGYYSFILTSKRNFKFDFIADFYSQKTFISHYSDLATFNKNNSDIKLHKTAEVVFKVFDSLNYTPIDVDFIISDFNSKAQINIKAERISKGKFTMKIPIGKQYNILISKKGYKNYNFTTDLSKTIVFNTFEHNIALVPRLNNLNILVTDIETNENINAEVYIENLSIKENQTITLTTDNNKQKTIKLRENNNYYIEVTNVKGYAYDMETLLFDNKMFNKSLNIKLPALTMNKEFELLNIDFEKNSSYIKEESCKELNRIANLILNNPTIKLEIAVFYYDEKKSDGIKKQLAQLRAEEIVGYLTDNKISNERLTTQSFITTPPITGSANTNGKKCTVIVKINGL